MIKNKILLMIVLLNLFFLMNSQNVVVVIIDGARYTETFGDPNKTYIPNMANLALEGAYCDEFYNEHITYTSQAIPALWTGGWAGTRDTIYQGNSTQYSLSPSVFEYFRKQKDVPETQAYYTLKYVNSLWLQSFHDDYGPDYWPATISTGSSDNDVLATTLDVMENEHPQFLWVYLADVDSEGHSGIWNNYIASIENADNIVNTIWETIQADNFYKDNTTMFVTNDHGRHDDQNGGFSGHGCSCEGCRHIMFLAVGPNIKQNFISTDSHEIEDAAVTVSHILDVIPEYSTGSIIDEIFTSSNVKDQSSDVNLKVVNNEVRFYLKSQSNVLVELFNVLGQKLETISNSNLPEGDHRIHLKTSLKGIYILRLQSKDNTETISVYLSNK